MRIAGYILLTLAGVSDFLDGLPSKRDVYRQLYGGRSPYKRGSLYPAVGRLLEAGEIDKMEKDGQPCFRVTPRGFRSLQEIIPVARLRQRWDGRFRVVVFDVAEKQKKDREFVRGKLKSLGFVMLQESVWVSPFAVEKSLVSYFEQFRIAGEVLVLRAEILAGDLRHLARRAWHLDELEEGYRELIESWEDLAKKTPGEAGRWELHYLDLLARDPLLPVSLLPEDWIGEKAKRIYLKEVRKFLV